VAPCEPVRIAEELAHHTFDSGFKRWPLDIIRRQLCEISIFLHETREIRDQKRDDVTSPHVEFVVNTGGFVVNIDDQPLTGSGE
jgi:hypothetical protein